MFFQPVTPSKLATVVEGDRPALFFMELFEALFDSSVNMIGIPGLNLGDDGVSRLAVNQSDDAARAGWSQHAVTFPITDAQASFDRIAAIPDWRPVAVVFRVFPFSGPFAAASQKRLPVVPMLVFFNPTVDRLR